MVNSDDSDEDIKSRYVSLRRINILVHATNRYAHVCCDKGTIVGLKQMA